MNKYLISIKCKEGELEQIMDELQKAQRTIYTCYTRLQEMGVLTLEKAAEAESDS